MTKYILPLVIFLGFSIVSCSDDKQDKQVATTTSQSTPTTPTTTASTTGMSPAATAAQATPATPGAQSTPERMSTFLIGTSMNTATAMVVGCLGIENNVVDAEKLKINNDKVQKTKKELMDFKEKNPNYFAPDTQHFLFYDSFMKFGEASEKLVGQIEGGNLKSYNAALSKAYNVVSRAYGEYEF